MIKKTFQVMIEKISNNDQFFWATINFLKMLD